MSGDIKRLTGECDSVTLRVCREHTGKYSLFAELRGIEGDVLDSEILTEHRPMAFLTEELLRAVGELEMAINRGNIVIVPG